MRTRLLASVVIGLAAVSALTACGAGGAQNQDPAGQEPGASVSRTDPTKENGTECTVALDGVLQAISAKTAEGSANPGYIVKGDGGWYIAAFLGDQTVNSTTIGLFGTTSDATSTDFSGTLYALNGDAADSTTLSTTVPGTLSATSESGKRALACAKSASKVE